MPVPFKAWLLLTSGPVLFLIAIVGTSVFLGLKGVDANQIAERVTLFMPHILLGVVLSMGVLILFLLRVDAVWVLPHATKAINDVVIGMLVGGLLAISYIFWIGPALAVLQREIGDYVPAGAVLSTISGNIGLFFIANVMLAPLSGRNALSWLCYSTPQRTFWRRLGCGYYLPAVRPAALAWRYLVYAAHRRSRWRYVCRSVLMARWDTGAVCGAYDFEYDRVHICVAHATYRLTLASRWIRNTGSRLKIFLGHCTNYRK